MSAHLPECLDESLLVTNLRHPLVDEQPLELITITSSNIEQLDTCCSCTPCSAAPRPSTASRSSTSLSSMADDALRSSQDSNSSYAYPEYIVPHYLSNNDDGFAFSHGPICNSTIPAPYPLYPSSWPQTIQPPSSSLSTSLHSDMALHYYPRSSEAFIPSLSFDTLGSTYSPPTLMSQRPRQSPRRLCDGESSLIEVTESQDSINRATGASEPVLPPLHDFPQVDAFDRLMDRYVQELSPVKQDKALIGATRAADIKAVLLDRRTTSVGTAQFRFWAKKMFTLVPDDPTIPEERKKVCHEGKPVAIREKMFKILTKAHKASVHGGRDRTSSEVRNVYSWVPKELISRFVKLCPHCQVKRPAKGPSPKVERSPDALMGLRSPGRRSTNPRRASNVAKQRSSSIRSATPMAGCSSTWRQQSRWMTFGLEIPRAPYEHEGKLPGHNHNTNGCGSPSLAQHSERRVHDSSTLYNRRHEPFAAGNGMHEHLGSAGYSLSRPHPMSRHQSARPSYGVKGEHHYS